MDILLILATVILALYYQVNIIPVIRDLLLKSQKVTVPGFGSLVIVHTPAQINKAVRTIAPPKMSIRFDKSTKDDDGTISGYLVRRLKLTSEKAEQVISEFINTTGESLKLNGTADWEGLGTLKQEANGDLGFIPEPELLRRISLFELPSIAISQPAKTEETGKPVSDPVMHTPSQVREMPVMTPVIDYPKPRKWWIPVAILVIFIVLLVPVYITGNLDMLLNDFSGLFVKKEKPVKEKLVFGNPVDTEKDTTTQDISRKLDEQVDRDKAFAYKEPETKAGNEISRPVESPANTVTDENKPYHIISGAFLVPNNAERIKNELEQKGLNPVILPKKGDYYMVSLGSFSTRAEAVSAMKQMQRQVKNELWVLKR